MHSQRIVSEHPIDETLVTSPAYSRHDVQRVESGHASHISDDIAEEIPVALSYNGTPHVVMMATPQDIDDFVLGFSLTEGLVSDVSEVQSIHSDVSADAVSVSVQIPEKRHAAMLLQRRSLAGRSGCGICGMQELEQVLRKPASVGEGTSIIESVLKRALAHLHDNQSINAKTGATHAAAWATPNGDIALLREDVGRHNALDKLIGAMTFAKYDFNAGFLLITSRASYEMALKAATAGISLMVAISAPTMLAIRVAEEVGLTLVGFARRDSYVIYTHAQRLLKNSIARST